MNTIKVNSRAQFLAGLSSGKKYAIAKFYRDGCKPCKNLHEEYVRPRENIDIDFYEVNHNENKFISKQFNVRALPTVILFEDGQPIERMQGLKEAEKFFEIVDSVSGLNFAVEV